MLVGFDFWNTDTSVGGLFLLKQVAAPTYKNIATNTYLLNALPALQISCNNYTRRVNDCLPCIVSLPCNCLIKTARTIIAENLDMCTNNTNGDSDQESVLYPVNLALVNAFYEDVNGTFANELFNTPPILPAVNFKFFGDELAHLASKDERLAYSLAKLSSSLQNSSVILGTPLEVMMHEFLNTPQRFWDTNTNSWFTYLILFLLAACIINFTLFWRLRRQLQLLSLAAVMTKTRVLAYSLKTTQTTVYDSLDVNKIFQSILSELRYVDFAMIALTLFTALILLIYALKLRNLSKRSSKLFLQIYLPNSTVEIFLMKLPLSTRDFAFTVPHRIALHVSLNFC